MKRLLLLAVVAGVLAGCGEKSEPTGNEAPPLEPFTVMLDYVPNADHAGLYAALEAGLYEQAGLDVKLQPPPDPAAPLRLLAAGRADVAISYQPELLLARDQGEENIVSVGALVQKPLTSLMALPSGGVRTPKDLSGKRVATAGIPYQDAYLKTILKAAGVEANAVQTINVGFNLTQAMLSKRADASLGSFWNVEGVDLQRRDQKPVILRMEEIGVPTYNELIFVARRQDLDAAGASRLRRFLSTTAAGHRLLRKTPQAGVDALVKADKGLEPELLEAQIKATLPVFFPTVPAREDRAAPSLAPQRTGDLPWGWQEPVEWAAYERWMRAENLLTRPPSEASPVTNEFLPGEGLGQGSRG
ncbi:ABC transporter substrate-binding protein [Solirubrobacter sp. CPCC 204708]|uniref:ABC transporter substrate-binding protein n=1 Tax=Solirubrobacter deserti TaxID=2282478 RepID=A0ABT4RPT5_9ACTN|nr:ABC transporter substrate-binding protein [Solirubrobacter deserti]MBE2318239.1 ABC transporter substrate-binding protein [Solirubrobacter deserti]MDA0140577.1 ABC transporter substrate-binding protein [Solirubrobacter deserti]